MIKTRLQLRGFRRARHCAFAGIVACVCGLLVSACRTDKSGTGSMASVVINGAPAGVVRGATIDVFENEGYKLARRDQETMVFEKAGSAMNNLAYGNWMEKQVVSRVQVYVEPIAETTIRVRCNGYVVRDKGGATEEQIKPLRRAPYQKLLEEVAKRFSNRTS